MDDKCAHERCPSLNTRLATDETVLPYEELLAAATKKKEAAAAQNALNKMGKTNTKENDLTTPGHDGRKRGGRGKGRGKGKRTGRGDGADGHAPPPKAKCMLPAESSDSSSSGTDDSAEEYWKEIMNSLRLGKKTKLQTIVAKAGQSPPAKSGHAHAALAKQPAASKTLQIPPAVPPHVPLAPPAAKGPPPAPPPVPPAPTALPAPPPAPIAIIPRPRGPGGPREPRLLATFGMAKLFETTDGGRHIGYRITCGRHENATDTLECMKHITMGTGASDDPLTEQECVRRLKRWFIGGAWAMIENTFREGEKRTCHLEYGGRRLNELASDDPNGLFFGWPDAELDDMCRAVTPLGLDVHAPWA